MSETKIGKYTILAEIGRGAMGIVYKATDPYIGRTVAVKTIRFDVLGQGPEREMAQKRFMREAHSAGNLSHPNIVTIYDVGEDEGLSYIAMEFIDGTSLEDLISGKRKLPLDDVIHLVEKVGDALDTAHRKGVVHRDIKPANILLDQEGRPYLVDFGIARISTSTMTQTNMIMGTPYYMSPEQIAGKKVDNRSDIFALGGVLYELLTGQKPFTGDSITTVIYKIMNETPLPMRTYQKNLPEGLEVIVQKALAKDPSARYQSCRDLVRDLQNFSALGVADTLVQELPPEARAAAVEPPPAGKAAGRRSKTPLLIGGGVAAVGLIVVAVLIFSGKPRPPAGPDKIPPPPEKTVLIPSAREVFLNAQNLMKEAQWDKALAAFGQVPAADPLSYEARFLSAEILRQMRRDAEAEKAYLGLTETRRDDSRVYLRLAQIYDKQNKSTEAISFYQTYLSFTPKGPEAEQVLRRLTGLQEARDAALMAKTNTSQKKQPEVKQDLTSAPTKTVAEKAAPAVKPPPVQNTPKPPVKTQPEQNTTKPPNKAEEKVEKTSPKVVETTSKPEPKKPAVLTAEQKADIKKLTEAGVWSMNRMDYSQAAKKFEQVLALDPGNEDAQRFLALAEQKLSEKGFRAQLRKANDALWYRRYEEAISEARGVLAVDPNNAEAKKIIVSALQGVQRGGAGQIEALAKEYTQSVAKGNLTGFFQKYGTPALYQRIRRDMELISNQYGDLKISVFAGSAKVTDFQADQTQGTVKRMAGEVTFNQILTGIPKSSGSRQVLFEGSILWRLERQGSGWKITEVVSTPKAKK